MTVRVAALSVATLLAACGVGSQMTPLGEATHRIRYVVRCEQCRVAYSIDGNEMASESVRGLWSKDVPIQRTVTGTVILTATPSSSAALVSHAYIMVDGDVVAETRRRTRTTFSDEVTLTARLPDAKVAGR